MSLCGAAEKLGTAGPGQAFRASELCYFLLQPQWPQGACAGIPPSTPRLSPKKTRCLRWEKKCTVSRLVANILKCQPFNIKFFEACTLKSWEGTRAPLPLATWIPERGQRASSQGPLSHHGLWCGPQGQPEVPLSWAKEKQGLLSSRAQGLEEAIFLGERRHREADLSSGTGRRAESLIQPCLKSNPNFTIQKLALFT